MSAYLCGKNHIVYIVSAAMSRQIARSYTVRWHWDNPHRSDELRECDHVKAADVANMLIRENLASVSYRYPDDKTSATLPGDGAGLFVTPTDFGRVYMFRPVQVLKSIACLDYQSCEHPAWRTSEARAFLNALERSAIHALPGWDDGEWGAPEPEGNMINLSALINRRR